MASVDVFIPKLTMSQSDEDTRNFFINFLDLFDSVNPSILTRTTDTGQLDPLSISFPVSNPYTYGYFIYKLEDSYGTYYLRFNFSTSGIGAPWTVALTVGTGTNGAGTITGAFISDKIVGYTGGTTSYGYNLMTVKDGFLFYNCHAHGPSTSHYGAGFCLSRLVDMDGIEIDDRLMFMNFRQNSITPANNHITGIGFYETVTNTEIYYTDLTGTNGSTYTVDNNSTSSPINIASSMQGLFTMPQSLSQNSLNYDEKLNLGKLEFFLEGQFVTSPNLIVGPYYGRKQTISFENTPYMAQTMITVSAGAQTCLYSKWD